MGHPSGHGSGTVAVGVFGLVRRRVFTREAAGCA
jgi:hypothetical protein